MKAQVSAIVLAMALSCAIASSAAAQSAQGARTDNGLGLPSTPSRSDRNSQRTPAQAQYHNTCLADRGVRCEISSRTPILPDQICHCGPYPGAILGSTQ